MSRRATCGTCLRAQAGCICQFVKVVAHPVEVVILQHPLEVANAKNSARLLHLSLPNSRLVVGEVFDPLLLHSLLSDKYAILLYPDGALDPSLGVAAPAALDCAARLQPANLRLVVLDATWRKSRKMLYQNPALQVLPRLALTATSPSRYLIRKAHGADQLSTLEATCYALTQLVPAGVQGASDMTPVIAGFDGFVSQQSSYFRQPL